MIDYRHALEDIFTQLLVPHSTSGDSVRLDAFWKKLSQFCAHHLQCTRLSYWYIIPDNTGAQARILFDQSTGLYTQGMQLEKALYLPYFVELQHSGLIAAIDAHVHPATMCFNQSYFDPFGIYSLLDISVMHQGNMVGFFCAEQCFDYKFWDSTHIDFMNYLSMLSTHYYTHILNTFELPDRSAS